MIKRIPRIQNLILKYNVLILQYIYLMLSIKREIFYINVFLVIYFSSLFIHHHNVQQRLQMSNYT